MGGGAIGNMGDCEKKPVVLSGGSDMGRLDVVDDGVISDSVAVWSEDSSDMVSVEAVGWCGAKRPLIRGWVTQ